MAENLLVTKADGTQEPLQVEKLRDSLGRSGASAKSIDQIVATLAPELHHGITTEEIYRRALAMLKKQEHFAASRYSLRRALFGFGPTGFPFEDFVSEMFKARGYKTAARVILKGKCVEHEVDVLATGNGKCIAAELKFHNDMGYKSDVKIALYVHARFVDIMEAARNEQTTCPITESWLITNTKFTTQAIQYGTCAGLTMVGWSYPDKGNLQDLIEESGIHPLTCLTTLSKSEKMQLLANDVVLCKTLPENPDVLRHIGVPEPKIVKIIEESQYLCQPGSAR
jgi:hypothetical protein